MRGAGPAAFSSAYERTTIPVLGRTIWSESTSFAGSPGATRRTPVLSTTGMTATSNVSTTPASSNVRHNSPPPNSQISAPGCAFSFATTLPGSWLTMRRPGFSLWGSVRENTTTSSPPMLKSPAVVITSYVFRPITAVSNCLYIAEKSIDESATIQSYSPFGPAMKPSRLTATPYRTLRPAGLALRALLSRRVAMSADLCTTITNEDAHDRSGSEDRVSTGLRPADTALRAHD